MTASYDISTVIGPDVLVASEVEVYSESEARFLPLRFEIRDDKYILYTSELSEYGKKESQMLNEFVPSLLDVEGCVNLCQKVLDLRINEIAKLLSISRATLDLHRKGKVKNFEPYIKLASFVAKIENLYTKDIHATMRRVLIERKTLVQHLLKNSDDLYKTMPYFEIASKKIGEFKVVKTAIDPNKAAVMFANIGKIV